MKKLFAMVCCGFVVGCVSERPVQRFDVPPLPDSSKGTTTIVNRNLVGFQPAAVVGEMVPWKYSVPASNYWWMLEESTNLTEWIVIKSGVTGELVVTNRGGNRFYRLRGVSE